MKVIFYLYSFIFSSSLVWADSANSEVSTVRTALVQKIQSENSHKYPIMSEYKKEAILYAPFAAFVTGILVNVGDRVQKGQALLELVHVQPEFSLKAHQIVSPISGQLADIKVKIGNQLNLQSEMIRVVDPKEFNLFFYIAQRDLAFIKKGIKGEATFFGLQPPSFPIVVDGISPGIDEVSGTSKVFVQEVAKKQGQSLENIRSGMLGTVKLVSNTKVALAVNKAAIFWHKSDFYVRVVEDSKAIKKVVKLGEDLENEMREVISGLEEGEVTIVSSPRYLKDAELVKVEN